MYLHYWGFTRPPFDDAPNPYFMFYTPEHERVLSGILSALAQNRGAIALTGEPGCGKTIIGRVIIQHLAARQKIKCTALVVNPALESTEFLGELLYQCGLYSTSRSREELLGKINEQLLENAKDGRNSTLIIDEAQAIPKEGFETINALLDFQRDGRRLVNILMMGLPEFSTAILENPRLDERIAVRYHLGPLDGENTAKYIRFRLAKAETDKHIFSDESLEKIYRHSGGIPRKINNICDLALVIGCEKKSATIDKEIVAEAARTT